MKLYLGLISSNAILCDVFEKEKERLIPREVVRNTESINRLNAIFSFGAYDTSNKNNRLSSEEYLQRATRNADGVILMIDKTCVVESGLRNAFFTVTIEVPNQGLNFRNFFTPKITRLLKNFSLLWHLMSRLDNEQAMRLPLRNFVANELLEIAYVCREQTICGDFTNQLNLKLCKLKERKSPRRKSNYPTLYFVDDNDLYFVFGKEEHSIMATGSPHNILCDITGSFRFGKKISKQRHFNVMSRTENTRISGVFPNCHDEKVEVKNRTHLNMFSNDQH